MKLARKSLDPVPPEREQCVEEANQLASRAQSDQPRPILYRGCSTSSADQHGPRRVVPVSGRGGAINKGDRLSSALTLKAATSLTQSAFFALAIGLGLNRFVTIHWQTAGVSDDLAATGRWLKLAGDWIRSRGGQLAYIWVRENGPDKGAHVHILIHLPPHLVDGFNCRQQGWIKACGGQRKRGVLYSRPIGQNHRHYAIGWIAGQAYAANLRETLNYVLKGADDAAHEALGLNRKEPGGELTGKRCGKSQNIASPVGQRGASALGTALKLSQMRKTVLPSAQEVRDLQPTEPENEGLDPVIAVASGWLRNGERKG